jgi:hypothetical protein
MAQLPLNPSAALPARLAPLRVRHTAFKFQG